MISLHIFPHTDYDTDRRIGRLRSLPFHELWLLVLDVPVIAAALVCTALPWRLYFVLATLKVNLENTHENSRHFKGWNSRISLRREYWRHVGWAFVEQAVKAFCDILALVGCGIIAAAGVWRLPMLIRDIWPTTAMVQDPKRGYPRAYYEMAMRFHSTIDLVLDLLTFASSHDSPCMIHPSSSPPPRLSTRTVRHARFWWP